MGSGETGLSKKKGVALSFSVSCIQQISAGSTLGNEDIASSEQNKTRMVLTSR